MMIVKILRQKGESVVSAVVMDRKGKIYHHKFNSSKQAKQWVFKRFNDLNIKIEEY